MTIVKAKPMTPLTARRCFGIGAAVVLIWGIQGAISAALSADATIVLTPKSADTALPILGAQVLPGDAVHLSIAREGLGWFFNGMVIGMPIIDALIALFGILFAYRFTRRVISGAPFTKAAYRDLVWVSVAIVGYPAVSNYNTVLTSNNAIGMLNLDGYTSVSDNDMLVLAIAVVAIIEVFAYAMNRGAKLERETEGLV